MGLGGQIFILLVGSDQGVGEGVVKLVKNHYEVPQDLDIIHKTLEGWVSTFSRCDPETKTQSETQRNEGRWRGSLIGPKKTKKGGFPI